VSKFAAESALRWSCELDFFAHAFLLVTELFELMVGRFGRYVKFESSGKTKQTKIINKNLNPKWNEEVEIEWSGDRKIDVFVYDHDLASKDDFVRFRQRIHSNVPVLPLMTNTLLFSQLGLVELWPATINEKADKWFDLKSRPGKSDKVTGQLHLKIVSN
jgi:hypothetical protein